MCRIELWPHGDHERKRVLYSVEIANVGGDEDVGDYRVQLHEHTGTGERARAEVKGFQRERGAVELLREALNALEMRGER